MGYDRLELAHVTRGDIAYHETGSGEPLILHHGGESHKGQYAEFAPLLSDGIWSISYDQRDVADSFSMDQPYTMAEMADDSVELMDALGIDRAHVMGMSFGGALCLNLAIRHPDRVQTLTVGATAATFKGGGPFFDAMVAAPPDEQKELMIQAVLSESGQRDPALLKACRDILAGGYSRPGSYRSAVLGTHDVTDRLGDLTVPTLVIHGADDPLITVDKGEDLAARIPGAQLAVIPDARHGLSFEFKAQTAVLVSDFVLAHPISPR